MIELNVDAGETEEDDTALYPFTTTVNLACGGHAGSTSTMRRGAEVARALQLRLFAHPSYPDREGFGRTSRFLDPGPATESVHEQCRSLDAIARGVGAPVIGVKLHGALYHDADTDPALALSMIRAAREAHCDLSVVVGPPGGALAEAARLSGLRFEREGFADRRYDAQGVLRPRSEPGALLTEPADCVEQALALARSSRFDTLCLHSDTAGSLHLVRAVRDALVRAGLSAPMASL